MLHNQGCCFLCGTTIVYDSFDLVKVIFLNGVLVFQVNQRALGEKKKKKNITVCYQNKLIKIIPYAR